MLWLSLGLNVVLAAAALYWLERPAAHSSPSASITNLLVVTARARAVETTNRPAAITYVTNQFHWRQIESTNYDEYVANLRAIGCPEKTVRDIIFADVEKHYQTRQEILNRSLERFWMGGKQRRLAERERDLAVEEMDTQKRELIRRLLGIEWIGDENPFRQGKLDEQALLRFILGPLPEETFQRLLAAFDKVDAQQREIKSRCREIRTDDDNAELKRLGETWKRELLQILTQDQFDEMAARSVAFEPFGGDRFSEAMELTPAEGRQIALAAFRTGTQAGIFDFGDDGEELDRATREMNFTNAVANMLGAERFEEFQRADDRDYRTLYQLGKKNGLPKETAIKVYDIRRLTIDEIAKVRTDPALDDAARRQHFERMQTELQQEISRLMGAKAYGEYLRQDGVWITNLTTL